MWRRDAIPCALTSRSNAAGGCPVALLRDDFPDPGHPAGDPAARALAARRADGRLARRVARGPRRQRRPARRRPGGDAPHTVRGLARRVGPRAAVARAAAAAPAARRPTSRCAFPSLAIRTDWPELRWRERCAAARPSPCSRKMPSGHGWLLAPDIDVRGSVARAAGHCRVGADPDRRTAGRQPGDRHAACARRSTCCPKA